MPDDPSGRALLDIAHRTLMDELAPKLRGRERYLALMIGNAISMVAREFDSADRHKATATRVEAIAVSHRPMPDRPTNLLAEIRAGRFDGDAALYAALKQSTIVAVGISKPGFLSPAERQTLMSTDGDDAISA